MLSLMEPVSSRRIPTLPHSCSLSRSQVTEMHNWMPEGRGCACNRVGSAAALWIKEKTAESRADPDIAFITRDLGRCSPLVRSRRRPHGSLEAIRIRDDTCRRPAHPWREKCCLNSGYNVPGRGSKVFMERDWGRVFTKSDPIEERERSGVDS